LLMRYVPRYSERQRLRLRVKPGLTGLAQLSGRNALDWNARLELDAQYAERISVLLDISLLLKTAWKVATREGVMVTGELEEFWGPGGKPAGAAAREGEENRGRGSRKQRQAQSGLKRCAPVRGESDRPHRRG